MSHFKIEWQKSWKNSQYPNTKALMQKKELTAHLSLTFRLCYECALQTVQMSVHLYVHASFMLKWAFVNQFTRGQSFEFKYWESAKRKKSCFFFWEQETYYYAMLEILMFKSQCFPYNFQGLHFLHLGMYAPAPRGHVYRNMQVTDRTLSVYVFNVEHKWALIEIPMLKGKNSWSGRHRTKRQREENRPKTLMGGKTVTHKWNTLGQNR